MYDYHDAAWSTADARNHHPTLSGAVGDVGFRTAAMTKFEKSYTTHVGYVFARAHTGTFTLMGGPNFVTRLCKLEFLEAVHPIQ